MAAIAAATVGAALGLLWGDSALPLPVTVAMTAYVAVLKSLQFGAILPTTSAERFPYAVSIIAALAMVGIVDGAL